MRRILLSFVVLCGLTVFTTTKAQDISVGPVVGVNIASLSSDADGFDPDSRTGIRGGAAANIGLSEKFSLRTGLIYAQKGASTERTIFGQTFETTQKYDYLEIPINAQVSFGEDFQFFVRAGGHLGFNLLAEVESNGNTTDVSDGISGTNFGIGGGAGILYPLGSGNLMVDVGYSLGVADINDSENAQNSLSTNALSGTVGYMFSF